MLLGIIENNDFKESVGQFLDTVRKKQGLQLYVIGGKYTLKLDPEVESSSTEAEKIQKARKYVSESIVERGLSKKVKMHRWDPID